jgi:type I restriction enzyme S subunit
MNETLEAMARALFKSWFVDFDPVRIKAEGGDPGLPHRLTDFFPDSFQDSEVGEIPKGWEVKSLDEIARFLNGLALQKYPVTDGRALPVIKISQLRAGNTPGRRSGQCRPRPGLRCRGR